MSIKTNEWVEFNENSFIEAVEFDEFLTVKIERLGNTYVEAVFKDDDGRERRLRKKNFAELIASAKNETTRKEYYIPACIELGRCYDY